MPSAPGILTVIGLLLLSQSLRAQKPESGDVSPLVGTWVSTGKGDISRVVIRSKHGKATIQVFAYATLTVTDLGTFDLKLFGPSVDNPKQSARRDGLAQDKWDSGFTRMVVSLRNDRLTFTTYTEYKDERSPTMASVLLKRAK